FEPDDRPIEFAVWLDDLQLFLLTDAKEGVSLFDYVSGTAVTPAPDAPALERSQWQTRDAAARLAIRNNLLITERAHFSQHRTAKTLYGAVVARYSSPATAAIGQLMLPYLFPDLSSFTTAEDLVSHLRATDSRFRAALSAEDHFLALDLTTLTVDDFEKHLLAAEKNIFAVGATRGTPRSPLFEGDHFLALDLTTLTVDDFEKHLLAAEKNIFAVGAASAPSGKRRSGRGGRGGRGGGGGGGGGGGAGGGGGGGGGGGRGGGRSGGGGGGGGGTGSGGGGSSGSGGGGSGGGSGGQGQQQPQQQQHQRQRQTPTSQQLLDWYARRGVSGGPGRCPYIIRTGPRTGRQCMLVQPYVLHSACCPCACMRMCMEWYEGMK
ncbi:unnamed protein product, partial [Closterium sp. NIES-54]